ELTFNIESFVPASQGWLQDPTSDFIIGISLPMDQPMCYHRTGWSLLWLTTVVLTAPETSANLIVVGSFALLQDVKDVMLVLRSDEKGYQNHPLNYMYSGVRLLNRSCNDLLRSSHYPSTQKNKDSGSAIANGARMVRLLFKSFIYNHHLPAKIFVTAFNFLRVMSHFRGADPSWLPSMVAR
ncbi:hypothetical protein PROFUN_14619, partial [Planoprotostelium fungivorum]